MPRGGARPGAGRKPKPKPETPAAQPFTGPDGTQTKAAPPNWPFGTRPPEPASAPVEAPQQSPAAPPSAARSDQGAHDFLKSIYQNELEDPRIRIQAAVAALPYEEAKLMPKGKRGDRGAPGGVEKPAGPSKFGALPAPRLVSSRN